MVILFYLVCVSDFINSSKKRRQGDCIPFIRISQTSMLRVVLITVLFQISLKRSVSCFVQTSLPISLSQLANALHFLERKDIRAISPLICLHFSSFPSSFFYASFQSRMGEERRRKKL